MPSTWHIPAEERAPGAYADPAGPYYQSYWR